MIVIKTSHIAEQSIKEIEKKFAEEKPDVVCLELDRNRLAGLVSNQQQKLSREMIKQFGVLGFLFAVIGRLAQQKLGGLVGIKPGSEMLTAFKEAQKINSKVYLIDQDIRVTLKKLSKEIPLREKFRLGWEIVKGPFSGQRMEIDLKKVPEQDLIKKLMEQFKDKLPTFYKVLVSDRNKIMSKRIKKIQKENPNCKLLVVVGAGHDVGVFQQS